MAGSSRDAALIVARPPVPGLQLSGDAVVAGEGVAASRQYVVQRLLPLSARGERGGGEASSRWSLRTCAGAQKWVGRAALEFRLVLVVGRRAGARTASVGDSKRWRFVDRRCAQHDDAARGRTRMRASFPAFALTAAGARSSRRASRA